MSHNIIKGNIVIKIFLKNKTLASYVELITTLIFKINTINIKVNTIYFSFLIIVFICDIIL